MAIINTFAKCLDSPYLHEDKDAPSGVPDLLARAHERLGHAVKVQDAGQGDPADTVYLAYESMYCSIRALVHAKGYRELGLRCLMLACESLYVRTGRLDVALLHQFENAQRMKTSPAEAVSAAGSLLARAREILSPGG